MFVSWLALGTARASHQSQRSDGEMDIIWLLAKLHSIWNKDFILESLNSAQFISLDKLFLYIQTTKHIGLFLHKWNQVGRTNKYKAFIQTGEKYHLSHTVNIIFTQNSDLHLTAFQNITEIMEFYLCDWNCMTEITFWVQQRLP